jgi:predicted transposase YbfD/YdcC
VTIDAMGCQTEIAAQIVAQQGDYVLALKGNQGDLHQDVQQLFDHAHYQNFRDIEHDFYETQEPGHGRAELRRYWVMGNTQYLIGAENWAKLTTIGCVESQRQVGTESRVKSVTICSVYRWMQHTLRLRFGVTGALRINCIGF